jgi:hypothetical protein
VLALAVGLRLAGLWSISLTEYADTPLVDAYTYWSQAQTLLEGKDPFSDGFYQPPAYPVMLWGLFSLVGDTSPQWVRGLQVLMGVVTTGLLMRAGRALGAPAGAPWAGAVAGAVYTLYPTTLLFELDLLTPAVTNLFLAAALALLLTGGPGASGPGAGRSLAAGLALGAAASFHPSTLLAALACGWGVQRACGWRAAGALALGAGLALAPTTGANLARFGRLSLVSQNDGLNFYLGNNPDWRETAFSRAGLEFRQLVLEADPAERDTTFARNAYWRSRAASEIAAAPWSFLDALATKAAWSVSDVEIPRNEDYRCRLQLPELAWLGRLPVSYGVVFPFALLGAAALWRRGGVGGVGGGGVARAAPLTWAALQLPLVLFLVADRYRLATWPALSLAAGAGAVALAGALARWRERPPRPAALAAFGIAALLPYLPIDARTELDPGWCLHQEANFAYARQDYVAARDLYRSALVYRPEDLSARSWLARALLEIGDAGGAVEALEPLVAAFPDSHPSLVLLSQALARSGDLSAAADAMGRAYRTPGPRANTGARYVDLLVRAGRREEALEVVAGDEELQRHPRVKEALGR